MASILGTMALPAGAQGQTIRLVFPFAAGGAGDAVTRMIADAVRERTGRSVIVENRAGAGGRIGIRSVTAAPADGTTLLLTPVAPISVFPHFFGDKLEYDPQKDLAPISLVATFDFSLAVASRVPAKSLQELVTWLKANPTEQSFGSPGLGTLPHLFGLQFSTVSGLDLRHVAYRGSAAALSDVVGGQVPIIFTTTADVVQQHKAGTIRVLGTSSRQSFLPEVPTFESAGYAIVGFGWYGLYAKVGTSAEWISEVARIVAESVAKPDNAAKLLAAGMVPDGGGPARLAEVQKADFDRWGEVIRRANVTIQP